MKNCYCGDKKEFQDLSDILKVLSDKNRLSIINILRDKEMCVCDICDCLNLSQNLASHHLKVLRDSDLVNSRKEGLKVICSLKKDNLNKLSSLFSRFIN